MDYHHAVAVAVTVVTVVMAVMLHYEAFIVFSRSIGRSAVSHRRRILILLFGVLLVHIVAIWMFGIAAWWLVGVNDVGQLTGYDGLLFLDYIFMSAVTYTTLGYGDMIPLGAVRFLYGTEALVGFVLITWSASFTFLEMQRNWDRRDR